MPDIIIGTKILVIKDVYRGKTGTITEFHRDDWDGEDFYSIIFDEPASVTLATAEGDLEFPDHRSILANRNSFKLLTELGEAVYGERLQEDSHKTP